MAHSDVSPHVRGQAIFWIAQKAGKKAGASITAAIENDPDVQVKKKAVFALSQLPQEEGVPQLMRVADSNSNPAIRKEAIFWLGQSKDPAPSNTWRPSSNGKAKISDTDPPLQSSPQRERLSSTRSIKNGYPEPRRVRALSEARGGSGETLLLALPCWDLPRQPLG